MSKLQLFSRTDRLLKKEFLHYFFPAMLTAAAFSLSEFVDAMIVANILDSRAMAIVQLGSPVMMVAGGIYILLGCGGSTLYAISLGQRDRDRAGRILSAATAASIVVGVLITALGLVFFDQVSRLICTEAELIDDFSSYLRVLLISMPFLIAVLTLVSFLPPAGSPGMATAVNVIANVVNIGMDVVYIKVFGMGAEGAAWATVTGYAVGALALLGAILMKKVKLRFGLPRLKDAPLLWETVVTGAPFSVSQIGYAIKFAVSGRLAQRWGGTAGMESFSLCIQVLSIVGSILMTAILEASVPIMAFLHGQRDHQGERLVYRNAFLMELLTGIVGAAVFFIFAKQTAALYNITDPGAVGLAVRSLRIFVPYIVARGVFVTLQKQAQVLGKKVYPLFMSLFDGVLCILPLCFLFTELMGIDGLFLAYSVTGALSLLICLVWNRILVKRSSGRLYGLLLYEKETESDVVMDATVTNSAEDISKISAELQKRCLELGMDGKKALRAALLVEEMGIFIMNRMQKKAYMDVLLRSYEDRIEIDFRTIGGEEDPNGKDEANTDMNVDENVRILRGIASEIKYDYVMGMNCTEIVLKK